MTETLKLLLWTMRFIIHRYGLLGDYFTFLIPDILSLVFPDFPQVFPKNRFWEKHSVFGGFLGNS